MDLARPRLGRGLRPLDRRARLAHPRRDRGRPAHPRRLLTVRGAGYVFARNQDEDLMSRLATQIHLTIVGVLVLFAALLGAAWWHGPGSREEARLAEAVAETAGEVLPGPERPPAELQAALERLAPRFGLTRRSSRRRASGWPGWGRRSRCPQGDGPRRHWTRAAAGAVALPSPDGRRLVASRPRPDWRHLGGWWRRSPSSRSRSGSARARSCADSRGASRGSGPASTSSAAAI